MTDKLPPSKFGAGYTYGGTADSTPAMPSLGNPPPAYQDPAAYSTPQVSPTGYQAPAQYGSPSAPYGSMPASPSTYGISASQYGVAAVPASGGTAITAAVLALLIAVYRGWVSVNYFEAASLMSELSKLCRSSDFTQYASDSCNYVYYPMIAGVVSAIGTVALFVGALLLFSRRRAGRGLVALGCLIAIADVVVTWAVI